MLARCPCTDLQIRGRCVNAKPLMWTTPRSSPRGLYCENALTCMSVAAGASGRGAGDRRRCISISAALSKNADMNIDI
jgi:hypothetical protein